jgi:hypothetical protein
MDEWMKNGDGFYSMEGAGGGGGVEGGCAYVGMLNGK